MGFLNNLFKKSKNDVYICYDVEDEAIAKNVCHVLESNELNCWAKFRDLTKSDDIGQIIEAISQSSLTVLILSKKAMDSNFVKNEVDEAFSKNKPILTFKIDDNKIEGSMEFFLKNMQIIDAYPDYEDYYEKLIISALNILGRNVKITVPVKEKKIEEKTSAHFTHDVFISYSTRDTEIANEICEKIENHGFKCWIAPRDIAIAENFAESLVNGIKNARIYLAVFSKEVMLSKYVLQELEIASSENKYMLAFNIDGSIPDGDYAMLLQAAKWTDYPNYDILIDAISQYLGTSFIKTDMEMGCDKYSCSVYEQVHIRGTLKSEKEALKNKTIQLFIDDDFAEEIQSDDEGIFEKSISFSKIGINSLKAVFEENNYLQSSALLEINVSRANPEISFNASSNSVILGDVIALSGSIKANDLPVKRDTVNIYNGETLVESVITNDEGNFSILIPSTRLETFEFKAIFEGNDFFNSCESSSLAVNVIESVVNESNAIEKPFDAYSGDKPYIFISYAHKDAGIVFPEIKRFHDEGYPIWYDQGLTPGQEWDDEVAEALLGCSLLVVFISKNSMGSSNVQDEIKLALDERIDIVPIYFEDTKLPPGLRLRLSNKHAIFKHSLSDRDYFSDCLKAFNKANISRIN